MIIPRDPLFCAAVRLGRWNYVSARLQLENFDFDLLLDAIRNQSGFFAEQTNKPQADISRDHLIGR